MSMSPSPSIYLDHASSGELRPCARAAMNAAWDLGPGNPASTHHAGRALRRLLEDAREKAAELLGAFPDELVFTSGATESNNLALTGLVPAAGGALLCSPIEHASVRQPLEALKRLDRPIVWVQPSATGQAALEALQAAFEEKNLPVTGLATLQLANQETGALQPVGALGAWLALHRPTWHLHTDATQAAGKIPINFHRLQVGSLAVSAHKFGGPVGVGLLLVRRGKRLTPLLKGGGQQDERRAGTESAALAAGLVAALEESCREMADFRQKAASMTADLLATLQAQCAPVLANSPEPGDLALPHILNLSFPGLRGDTLLMALDLERITVSAGSACASGSLLPSPVLLSMGLAEERVRSAIRISLGWSTRNEQVDEAARRIVRTVQRLRAGGPRLANPSAADSLRAEIV